MNQALIIALLAFVHCCAYAQTEFRSRHYGVEDGLSQSSVWCMLQDRRGFIWLGTADGLNRFDGYTFKVFRHNPGDSTSLSNNLVWSLCEDSSGAIWMGTASGIHRYDPLTESFTRLANQQRYKGTYLEALTRTILEDHKGMIWFGTVNGLAILDQRSGDLKQVPPSGFQPIAQIPGITVLHEDDHGDVWLGTSEYLFRYERSSGSIRRVPVGEKDGKFFPFRTWRDREGVYWFATPDRGVWSLNPATGRWQSYMNDPRNPTSLADNRLRSVCEDNDGRLWVGTIFRGLCYLDRSTDRFHSFQPSDEGAKNARYEGVSFILRDRSGLLWVGYDGAGVVKVNPYRNKFQHVLLPQSDLNSSGDNFFKALMVDRGGDVWLGMYDQGLSVLNRNTGLVKRYRHSPDPRSIRGNTILSLLEDRAGNIWIGTTEGLDEFDRRTGTFWHHDISSFAEGDKRGSVVSSMCEDSSGTVWVGTITHLLRFDRNERRITPVLSTPDLDSLVIPPTINVIAPASGGGLWIGTMGAGLLKLDGNGAVEKQFKHIPGSINSLSNNRVKTIITDIDGVLWIGTEEGLNRYDPQNDTWHTFRMKDGLPNEFIYGVLMDEKRNLWISTNRGISRMDTRDMDRPTFRNYTPDDGLQSFEFNTNCYFKMSDGHMLFGGVNGFNIFHPDSIRDNAIVPGIAITGFKKFDQPVDLGADIGLLQEIRLEPGESVFSFEFSALEFTNPELNRYAYRMEGFDKDWMYSDTRREARYTNLDHGTYVFRVKGTNNDGVWNDAGTSIRVVIVPPFWKTGWFIASMTLAVAAMFGGGVRYLSTRKLRRKVEQLEREKEIQDERLKTRERIARDLHDDLASTVGSAGLFIESVKKQMPDATPQAKEFLDKTSSLLTEAEEAMSDIVWSVSPRNDTLESLWSRIRIMTADLCKANRIRYEAGFSGDASSHTLVDEVRRNLYLIAKEAITNAVRHSGAGTISVSGKIEGDSLELTIRDDGKGIVAQNSGQPTKRGNGLRNIRNRAEEIRAELAIESAPGKGTTVRISKRMTQTGH